VVQTCALPISNKSGFFDVCRRSNGENYELQSQARVYCGAKSANGCYVKKREKPAAKFSAAGFFLYYNFLSAKAISRSSSQQLYHLKFLQDLKRLLYQKMTKESTLF